MKHLTEVELMRVLDAPDAVAPNDAAHLASCPTCTTSLEELREFAAALQDSELWLPDPASELDVSDDPMLLFEAQIAEEDRLAEHLLAAFEAMPPARFVWADIASDARLRTGGVVRRLCKRAHVMCESDPLYALALADTAIAIGAALADTVYPRNTVHEARGEAWKERTNALAALGRVAEALEALALAEAEYRQLPHSGAGIVAVAYIRAGLFLEQERFGEAHEQAVAAARAALHLGMVDRHMSARHMVGVIYSEQHRYADAAEIFKALLHQGERAGDELWIARESLAVAVTELELGHLDAAESHLRRARALHAKLGCAAEVIRTDWSIARLKFLMGDNADAVRRLRECVAAFTELGMLTDAALVAVDLADALIAAGRAREVARVLRGVVERFTRAGKLTSALTALAYVNDAAAQQRAIPPHVLTYIRWFIARADRHRELLFAPPRVPAD